MSPSNVLSALYPIYYQARHMLQLQRIIQPCLSQHFSNQPCFHPQLNKKTTHCEQNWSLDTTISQTPSMQSFVELMCKSNGLLRTAACTLLKNYSIDQVYKNHCVEASTATCCTRKGISTNSAHTACCQRPMVLLYDPILDFCLNSCFGMPALRPSYRSLVYGSF
jgi:hypothetical protein